MSDEDAPLPSAACPWCGEPTEVRERAASSDTQVLQFFVSCTRSSCRAAGPLRNNESLAVIAWNAMTQAWGERMAGQGGPLLTSLERYGAFLTMADLNFIEKRWRNHATGEGHVTLVVTPEMLKDRHPNHEPVYWDGDEMGVLFRFDVQTGKLLAVGTGGD